MTAILYVWPLLFLSFCFSSYLHSFLSLLFPWFISFSLSPFLLFHAFTFPLLSSFLFFCFLFIVFFTLYLILNLFFLLGLFPNVLPSFPSFSSSPLIPIHSFSILSSHSHWLFPFLPLPTFLSGSPFLFPALSPFPSFLSFLFVFPRTPKPTRGVAAHESAGEVRRRGNNSHFWRFLTWRATPYVGAREGRRRDAFVCVSSLSLRRLSRNIRRLKVRTCVVLDAVVFRSGSCFCSAPPCS